MEVLVLKRLRFEKKERELNMSRAPESSNVN